MVAGKLWTAVRFGKMGISLNRLQLINARDNGRGSGSVQMFRW